jgi:hypothetical protein
MITREAEPGLDSDLMPSKSPSQQRYDTEETPAEILQTVSGQEGNRRMDPSPSPSPLNQKHRD